ncbi:MAG: hypothetical protein P5698_24560, partial [Limnospira sp. PMC 1295.21]|uniref:RCC1 domain-containing protein n=2 Tax=unclassified Limnospira TaxID=2642885 RepID=UPI0028E10B68
DPNARVTVTLDDVTQQVTADATGRWQADFAPETLPGYGAHRVSVEVVSTFGTHSQSVDRDIRVTAIPEDVVIGQSTDNKGPGDGSVWNTGAGGEFAHTSAFVAQNVDGEMASWGNQTPYLNVPGHSFILPNATSFLGIDSAQWEFEGVAEQLRDGVESVASSGGAFAALKSDGSVITWGNPIYGGASHVVGHYQEFSDFVGRAVSVADELNAGVVAIYSNKYAFAALKDDGSVITWGDEERGGKSAVIDDRFYWRYARSDGADGDTSVAEELRDGVVAVYSTEAAFAALKVDGSVVTWGSQGFTISGVQDAGDSSAVAEDLHDGVTAIFSTRTAFAALKEDGSVVTWGRDAFGGDSSAVQDALQSGVVSVFSTDSAFAALKEDGSVITWGNPDRGGDAVSAAAQIDSGVVTVVSNGLAFAALKDDGSVVTWGASASGGDSSAVADELTGGVLHIHATAGAFAAIKADGSVITWGSSGHGGDSSEAADFLAGGVTDLAAPWDTDPLSPSDLVPTPAIPEIDPFAQDGVIGAQEQAEGLVIRGSADPGAAVRLTLAGQTHDAVADDAGLWSVALLPAQVPDFG